MEPHHDGGEFLLPTEETAEQIYKSFVDSIATISSGYLQLIENSPSASALQSVLIGRPPTTSTTWEEFMVTRLRFDLPVFTFTVDTTKGLFLAAPMPKKDLVTQSHSTGYKYPLIWKRHYKLFYLHFLYRNHPCSTYVIINMADTMSITISITPLFLLCLESIPGDQLKHTAKSWNSFS
jgi:hypothetical protein